MSFSPAIHTQKPSRSPEVLTEDGNDSTTVGEGQLWTAALTDAAGLLQATFLNEQ